MSDARTIIEKADVAVSDLLDGGKLNATQSDEFYQMVMDQPTILNEIRTVQMPSDKYNIDKIGFGSRMWRAAPSSGTSLAADERYRPTFDQIQLDAQEIISEFHIPYDVLEDSIEKGTLKQTFMQMASKRTSVDLQELVVLGDTTSSDAFLALVDGALQLPDHEYDGSSLTAIDKDLWKNAQQTMPSKYMTELDSMGFYLSPNNVINYRYTLAGQSADVGYNYYTGKPELNGFGVPVKQVSHLPDTKMLFTYPENIILGVHRDVLIETDKDIRRRALVVVMTARVDVKMEEPDAAVVVTGLSI